MTWFSSALRAIDPTRAGSVVRRGLRQLDPTLKSSAMAGIGRQLDVTNKNSIAGKVAPYAVGLIPGIGMPLAAGLGAGLRASQAVGRGEYGDIIGDAAMGALQGGGTQLASGLFRPGVPSVPTTGMPNMAVESANAVSAAGGIPAAPSMAGVNLAASTAPTVTPLASSLRLSPAPCLASAVS